MDFDVPNPQPRSVCSPLDSTDLCATSSLAVSTAGSGLSPLSLRGGLPVNNWYARFQKTHQSPAIFALQRRDSPTWWTCMTTQVIKDAPIPLAIYAPSIRNHTPALRLQIDSRKFLTSPGNAPPLAKLTSKCQCNDRASLRFRILFAPRPPCSSHPAYRLVRGSRIQLIRPSSQR